MAVRQSEQDETPIFSANIAQMVDNNVTMHCRNDKDSKVEIISNEHQGSKVQPPARHQQGIEPLGPRPRIIVILVELEVVVLVDPIIIRLDARSTNDPCKT
jgi:hypothetical protein